MSLEKQAELYQGKAKTVYATNDPDRLILLFRNDTSAFDGKKLAQLDRKGMVNNKFNAFIMQKLQAAGIPTHFESLLNDQECVVKKLTMLPVECVVRNRAAGSMCRRLGIKEGEELSPPTFEFFLKNDGDEFSPDGWRLWDNTTGEKMDKDRFRQDLGNVIEAYEQVAQRIGVPL